MRLNDILKNIPGSTPCADPCEAPLFDTHTVVLSNHRVLVSALHYLSHPLLCAEVWLGSWAPAAKAVTPAVWHSASGVVARRPPSPPSPTLMPFSIARSLSSTIRHFAVVVTHIVAFWARPCKKMVEKCTISARRAPALQPVWTLDSTRECFRFSVRCHATGTEQN